MRIIPIVDNALKIFCSPRRLFLNRYSLAFLYIRGEGIEIGALHNPLRVAPWAKVRYVDRMTVADLRRQYPELQGKKLVPVDIVADGELLESVDDASQDFVIANHFLEHCQNPLQGLENMFRVLRPEGILYLALPDKRYTYDRERPLTLLEHLLRDYREGPDWSRRGHFEEWVRLVIGVDNPEDAGRQVEELMAMNYSIHYHVWTQFEMLEMLHVLRQRHLIDIEIMHRRKDEVIFIIRRAGV
jgi:SAM-dependent methyltransferase